MRTVVVRDRGGLGGGRVLADSLGHYFRPHLRPQKLVECRATVEGVQGPGRGRPGRARAGAGGGAAEEGLSWSLEPRCVIMLSYHLYATYALSIDRRTILCPVRHVPAL